MLNRDKVFQLIHHEHELRPDAELVDYYKLFFQGCYGPGHMIHDRESARDYLKHELLRMHAEPKPINVPPIEDIGWYGRYYRVNMHIIASGQVDLEQFLDAFYESACILPKIDLDQWRKMWTEILEMLYVENNALKTFDKQKQEIDAAFEVENPLFHHSQRYRDLYHPHYRVIHANLIDSIRKELQ